MNNSEAKNWHEKMHVIMDLKNPEDNKILMAAHNDFITFLRRGGYFDYESPNAWVGTIRLYVEPHPGLQYFGPVEVQEERFLNFNQIAWHRHDLINMYIVGHRTDGIFGPINPKYVMQAVWNHALKLQGSKSKFNYLEFRIPRAGSPGNYFAPYFTKSKYQELFEKGNNGLKKTIRRITCSRGTIPPLKRKKSEDTWLGMWIEHARYLARLVEIYNEIYPPELYPDDRFRFKPQWAIPYKFKIPFKSIKEEAMEIMRKVIKDV